MRYVTLSRLLAVLTFTLVFSLTACGSASQLHNSGTPTATSTVQASATVVSGTVTPGQVKLVLDTVRYGLNDAIAVTIVNGLSTSIYASAYHSDCTLVTLEWKTATGWVARGRCLSAVPHVVELSPGSATPQQLVPVASTFRPTSNGAWQAGMYRIIFAYNVSPDEGSTSGTEVESENFTIG